MPEPLQVISGAVLRGDLRPDRVWIGPLEWALLEAVGVRWPEYPIRLARLGDTCSEELERAVGRQLQEALADYLPLVHGAQLDALGVLRWFYWYVRPDAQAEREFLQGAAAQVMGNADRPGAARRSAALAVLGLALLGCGGAWTSDQIQALRAVEASGKRFPAAATLARRLLRNPADACGRGARDEYWKCCDTPDMPAEGAATVASTAARPGNRLEHGGDFTWVRWRGERFDFTRPMQRAALAVLWEDYEQDGGGVSESTLEERLGTRSFRVATTFRLKNNEKHPALERMIVRKGERTWRLRD